MNAKSPSFFKCNITFATTTNKVAVNAISLEVSFFFFFNTPWKKFKTFRSIGKLWKGFQDARIFQVHQIPGYCSTMSDTSRAAECAFPPPFFFLLFTPTLTANTLARTRGIVTSRVSFFFETINAMRCVYARWRYFGRYSNFQIRRFFHKTNSTKILKIL